jgi:hypothetical protein
LCTSVIKRLFEVTQKHFRTIQVWKYLASSDVRFVTEKKFGIYFLQQYFHASLQISLYVSAWVGNILLCSGEVRIFTK